MKVIFRDEESGVSEVIGTILILAMTVVLFSTIILWVGSFPTPTVRTHVDIRSTITPILDGSGNEIGVNITLLHQGVEVLRPAPTVIYVISQRGTNPPQTDTEILHLFDVAIGSGLLDGPDSMWDTGERWAYRNFFLRSSDQISVTIVDRVNGSIVWSALITAPMGSRPPIFVQKWADGFWNTNTADPVESRTNFFLFAKVVDPDGDLNASSVFATITAWFGSGNSCAQPQQMRDDGVYPDRVAGDGILTLGGPCLVAEISWDGSLILLEARDTAVPAHVTTTRLILSVVTPSGPVSGSTLNAGFDTSSDGWTYNDWVDASSYASGSRVSSGGNPGGYVFVATNCQSNSVVSGYFFQPFLVSGAGPFTARINLDWRITAFGATGGGYVVFYVFVDTSPGLPNIGTRVWNSTSMTSTTSWTGVSSVDASSRIPSAGTYYLKLAVVANHVSCGGTTRGAFDNAIITWTSSG